MPASFARYASSSVRPVGYVKDIDEFLSTVRLTVAPLRYGAGVKGKIGSSLANGVPCVATPLAVEGMKLVPGEMVAVAVDPDEFASQIVALLQDEVAWTRMSDAAARFAVENYSLQAARARIEGMLERLGLPAAGDTLRKPGARKGDPGGAGTVRHERVRTRSGRPSSSPSARRTSSRTPSRCTNPWTG